MKELRRAKRISKLLISDDRKLAQVSSTNKMEEDKECPIIGISNGLLSERKEKTNKKGKRDEGRKAQSRPSSPDKDSLPISGFMDDNDIHNKDEISPKYQTIHDRFFTQQRQKNKQ